MSEAKVLSVSMGEIAISWQGETLKSILGSCVGIGLFFQEKNLFGLAHCVLPESPIDKSGRDARFVDQAVPYLLQSMGVSRSEYEKVEAIIIGGASMLAPSKYEVSKSSVGAKNIASAIESLGRHGIKIVFENVGKDFGRQLTIHGKTGKFEVHAIGKLGSRKPK